MEFQLVCTHVFMYVSHIWTWTGKNRNGNVCMYVCIMCLCVCLCVLYATIWTIKTYAGVVRFGFLYTRIHTYTHTYRCGQIWFCRALESSSTQKIRYDARRGLCVYVCICMYSCMHVCMYACMHWRAARLRRSGMMLDADCVCMYVYVCIHACMHVCMHVCLGEQLESEDQVWC